MAPLPGPRVHLHSAWRLPPPKSPPSASSTPLPAIETGAPPPAASHHPQRKIIICHIHQYTVLHPSLPRIPIFFFVSLSPNPYPRLAPSPAPSLRVVPVPPSPPCPRFAVVSPCSTRHSRRLGILTLPQPLPTPSRSPSFRRSFFLPRSPLPPPPPPSPLCSAFDSLYLLLLPVSLYFLVSFLSRARTPAALRPSGCDPLPGPYLFCRCPFLSLPFVPLPVLLPTRAVYCHLRLPFLSRLRLYRASATPPAVPALGLPVRVRRVF